MQGFIQRFVFLLSFICLAPTYALDALREAEDRRDVGAIALTEAAQSPLAEERARAATAWGRIQKADGVDPLLQLLQDKDPRVQKAALFALGQLGWQKTFSGGRENEISEKIVAKLKSSDTEIRQFAVEALGKIALDKTPDYLVPALRDSQPLVRAAALLALYRYRLVLRTRDSSANPALLSDAQINEVLRLANDKHNDVQKNLAYYFQRVKDPRGQATVLKLSQSSQLWTRFYAVSALAKYSGPEINAALLNATEDESSVVRTAALQGIATLKLASDLSPGLRGDPSYHVRIAYVQALNTLAASPELKAKLQELFLDAKVSVKAEALKALAPYRAEDTNLRVQNASESKNWVLRAAAAQAAVSLEANLQREILEKSLQDEDTRVRVAALEVLSPLEVTYAYPALKKALSSAELSERGTAVAALSSRSEDERLADAHVTYIASADEKWIELREEIVKLWASIVSDETTLYLREASLDANSSVAQLAVSALAARGIVDIPATVGEEKMSFSPYREKTFKRNPKLTLVTAKGALTVELYPEAAPLHVANLVGFAEEKKYDGLPFHRVVSNFVVQGGDPDKSGWGSAGYSLRAEINTQPFARGALGMPRSTGFDTGGIQFFINHVPTPHLDGQYTVFGKVIEGLDVLDQLEVGDLILQAQVEL